MKRAFLSIVIVCLFGPTANASDELERVFGFRHETEKRSIDQMIEVSGCKVSMERNIRQLTLGKDWFFKHTAVFDLNALVLQDRFLADDVSGRVFLEPTITIEQTASSLESLFLQEYALLNALVLLEETDDAHLRELHLRVKSGGYGTRLQHHWFAEESVLPNTGRSFSFSVGQGIRLETLPGDEEEAWHILDSYLQKTCPADGGI